MLKNEGVTSIIVKTHHMRLLAQLPKEILLDSKEASIKSMENTRNSYNI